MDSNCKNILKLQQNSLHVNTITFTSILFKVHKNASLPCTRILLESSHLSANSNAHSSMDLPKHFRESNTFFDLLYNGKTFTKYAIERELNLNSFMI